MTEVHHIESKIMEIIEQMNTTWMINLEIVTTLEDMDHLTMVTIHIMEIKGHGMRVIAIMGIINQDMDLISPISMTQIDIILDMVIGGTIRNIYHLDQVLMVALEEDCTTT